MFSIPDSYNAFKVLAIDPGLNNIGVAVFDINAVDVSITKITALTLKEERVLQRVTLDDDYVPERTIKRQRMVDAVMRVVRSTDPVVFVSESPFFNRSKPGSFAVLTEVISDIFHEVLSYNNNIRLLVVEPLLVKHTLGVAGQKGKEVVCEAMAKMPEIVTLLETPLETLDEHAIDAIGVGYTFFKRRLTHKGSKK